MATSWADPGVEKAQEASKDNNYAQLRHHGQSRSHISLGLLQPEQERSFNSRDDVVVLKGRFAEALMSHFHMSPKSNFMGTRKSSKIEQS